MNWCQFQSKRGDIERLNCIHLLKENHNIISTCLSQGSYSSVASRCCIFEEFYSHSFMASATHGDCREAAPTFGITECTNTSRPLGFRHQVLQAMLLQKSCSNQKKSLRPSLRATQRTHSSSSLPRPIALTCVRSAHVCELTRLGGES